MAIQVDVIADGFGKSRHFSNISTKESIPTPFYSVESLPSLVFLCEFRCQKWGEVLNDLKDVIWKLVPCVDSWWHVLRILFRASHILRQNNNKAIFLLRWCIIVSATNQTRHRANHLALLIGVEPKIILASQSISTPSSSIYPVSQSIKESAAVDSSTVVVLQS